MAMWIIRERAQVGPVFGSVDRFTGLGIFFDTYKNGRSGTIFPYVMAMLGDGQTSYDNFNDGQANDVGGCSVGNIMCKCLYRLELCARETHPQRGN
jgi:mannose-binding lectin 2